MLRPRPAVVVLRPAPVPRAVDDKAPTTVAEALSPVSPLDLKSSLASPADATRRARSTPPELTRRGPSPDKEKVRQIRAGRKVDVVADHEHLRTVFPC